MFLHNLSQYSNQLIPLKSFLLPKEKEKKKKTCPWELKPAEGTVHSIFPSRALRHMLIYCNDLRNSIWYLKIFPIFFCFTCILINGAYDILFKIRMNANILLGSCIVFVCLFLCFVYAGYFCFCFKKIFQCLQAIFRPEVFNFCLYESLYGKLDIISLSCF